tara:strand:+ start:688 stop:1044 length:357 start_codon:yes stop_codon:yes gene_type:complete
MASITINFAQNINNSLQVGDTVYYCSPQASPGGFQVNNTLDDIIKMGDCILVSSNSIVVDCADNVTAPAASDFVLFSKDNSAELSSIIGYFAEVKFVSNSTTESELFGISVEVSESSK